MCTRTHRHETRALVIQIHATRTYVGTYIYNLSTYWALRFGGPPRLDLRLFNSSACQKHQCTLCSPIVLSFSLFTLPASFALLFSFSHFSFLSVPSSTLYHPLAVVFPFGVLFSSSPLPWLAPSTCTGPPFSPFVPLYWSSSLILSSPLLSSRRSLSTISPPSTRATATVERLGAIRCDNCP